MKTYILMGTHLAEIRHCIRALARVVPAPGKVQVHVPEGLEWSIGDTDAYTMVTYDPESVLWVLDPDSEDTCFIIIDPRAPLIGQIEHLAGDLAKCLVEPIKIVTCVDSDRTEKSTALRAWLDACIYYSDVVLLGNRQNASKPFLREYQKHYERLCYPCLFLFLKGEGQPNDPIEILTPGIRRISQLFDIETGDGEEPLPGMVIESSCDLYLEEEENDPFRSPDEEQGASHVPDPSGFIVPAS